MQKVRQAVAQLSDLTPDRGKIVPLGDDGGLCTLVLHEGACYAVGHLCPHQNALLANAPAYKGNLVCRVHGFHFDLKTGDCRTVGGYGIPTYEVEVEDDTVFVSYWKYEE